MNRDGLFASGKSGVSSSFLLSYLGFFTAFFYLLCFPAQALDGARQGLILWYRSVLPILFPFMALCGAGIGLGLIERLPAVLTKPLRRLFCCSSCGVLAIFTGFLCGFPMGAKITADLYKQGKISPREARWLIGFVNNLSPAFILSFLAKDQMALGGFGWIFLLNILGAAILYGLLTSRQGKRTEPKPPALQNVEADESSGKTSQNTFPRKSAKPNESSGETSQNTFPRKNAKPNESSGKTSQNTFPRKSAEPDESSGNAPENAFQVLDRCISDSVQNVLRLGAYIMLFSILSQAAVSLLPEENPFCLFLAAFVEVTKGVSLISSSGLPFPGKYIMVNALCAFGGLSALAQTVSIASMDRELFFYYIKSRVIITLLCILISVISVLFLLGLPMG